MIPESSANGSVELWRATEFPFTWSLEKTLFRGPLVDTTPLFHEGRWYFFTALIEPRGRPAFGALFSADQLTGEWVHHPSSPICTDVRRARSAGPIQRLRTRLIRPVQDCSEAYGHRIHVQEILELTPTTYRERCLHSIEPDWEKGLKGVHTYGTCAGVEVLDAVTYQDRRNVYPAVFRPTEVDALQGDSTKARSALGWKPEIDFEQLVRAMVASDLELGAAPVTGKAGSVLVAMMIDVRLFAWWYICIGLAFVALAGRASVAGAPGWSVGLRLLVAIGFVLLGVVELRRWRGK